MHQEEQHDMRRPDYRAPLRRNLFVALAATVALATLTIGTMSICAALEQPARHVGAWVADEVNASGTTGIGASSAGDVVLLSSSSSVMPRPPDAATIINLDLADDALITGIDSDAADGRVLELVNASNHEATIADNDAYAPAMDRVMIAGDLNLVLPPRGSVALRYSGAMQRWVELGHAPPMDAGYQCGSLRCYGMSTMRYEHGRWSVLP